MTTYPDENQHAQDLEHHHNLLAMHRQRLAGQARIKRLVFENILIWGAVIAMLAFMFTR